MAEFPDVIVQVAWTTDPRTRPADPGGWTTISTETENPPIETLTVDRGLNMKANTIEAGTASIVLDNENRKLDPANTSSPYSPNVKPRKRIRVRLDPPEDGEAVRDIFTGFVERWPIEWSQEDAWVKVEASDLLALIADEILPPSVLEYEVLQDSPLNFWPLTETFVTTAEDIAGVTDATWESQPSASVDPIIAGSSENASVERADVNGQMYVDGTQFTISGWVSGAATIFHATAGEFPQGDDAHVLFVAGSTGAFIRAGTGTGDLDAGLYVCGVPSAADMTTGHMFTATFDGTTTRIFLDGVELAESEEAVSNYSLGGVFSFPAFSNGSAQIGEGACSHVAYWDTVLSDAAILAQAQAGLLAWSGDTTSERLSRILDALGIDVADRNISTGTEICGPTVLGEQNAVEYLRKIAATEQSPLFVSGDGKITFPGQLANAPTIAETFDDDAASAVRWTNISLDYSLDRVINTASVKREGGNTQTASDATSQDDYGILNGGLGVIETLHRDPSGPRSLASSLVVKGHEPRTVIASLDIDARDDESTVAACLDLEIGVAATVKATPPGGGPQISQDCFIEKVAHRMTSPLSWTVSYGLSEFVTLPAFAWDTTDQGWDESVWSEPAAGSGGGGFLLLTTS